MVALPAPVPVTVPVGDTLATVVGTAAQVPVPGGSDNICGVPIQIPVVPVIGLGVAFTVSVVVAVTEQRPPKPNAIGSL